MLPDRHGILRPHHLREDTMRTINTLVEAEERMEAAALGQSSTLMPNASLRSVPSTTSLQSMTSAVSQQSHFSTQNR